MARQEFENTFSTLFGSSSSLTEKGFCQEIGKITSGTFGPSINAPVAMGYINLDHSGVGNKIKIEVRGKKYDAKLSQLPFYKKNYVK